ncbi:MAG: EAL domain-containing protein, partial [Proteobacteria bacterium]|nr:EAL domain-containing protein [Pseudomonadota bacterium]
GATLLRRADLAMRAARRTGAAVVRFAGAVPESEPAPPPLGLAAELDDAMRLGQIDLVFQPKVGMAPVEFHGVEALVRWHHPRFGMLPPDQFIPAAEQTGVVAALSLHVLELALARQREWRAAGSRIPVAVNLSAISLLDPALPDTIAQALNRHRTPAGDLTLEITESVIVAGLAQAAAALDRLHAAGVRISIDDFGAGFTSLAFLGRLPVAELKLDRLFAGALADDGERGDDGIILRSLIGLGRSLGLTVVAEGVESAPMWRALADLDCQSAQGFFVSRPLPAAELLDWVRNAGWRALAAPAGAG